MSRAPKGTADLIRLVNAAHIVQAEQDKYGMDRFDINDDMLWLRAERLVLDSKKAVAKSRKEKRDARTTARAGEWRTPKPPRPPRISNATAVKMLEDAHRRRDLIRAWWRDGADDKWTDDDGTVRPINEHPDYAACGALILLASVTPTMLEGYFMVHLLSTGQFVEWVVSIVGPPPSAGCFIELAEGSRTIDSQSIRWTT